MICQCCAGGAQSYGDERARFRVASFWFGARNSKLKTRNRPAPPLLTVHKSRVISLGQRQQAVGQLITLARRQLVLVEGIRTTALAAESSLPHIQVHE